MREPLRNSSRERCTEIVSDHAKRQIETCAHSGRRPDRPDRDENAILFHFDFRKTISKLSSKLPMRRRALAVEHAGFGEEERAGAYRTDAPAYWERPSDEGNEASRRRPDIKNTADQQCVETRI